MKKIIFMLVLLAGFTSLMAQSKRYIKAMQDQIASLDSVRNTQALLDLSAAFERIGDAEKTQWLPYYYASLSQVIYAFMKNDMSQADAYANKADALLKKADALQPNNSEVSCIKSMIATPHQGFEP